MISATYGLRRARRSRCRFDRTLQRAESPWAMRAAFDLRRGPRATLACCSEGCARSAHRVGLDPPALDHRLSITGTRLPPRPGTPDSARRCGRHHAAVGQDPPYGSGAMTNERVRHSAPVHARLVNALRPRLQLVGSISPPSRQGHSQATGARSVPGLVLARPLPALQPIGWVLTHRLSTTGSRPPALDFRLGRAPRTARGAAADATPRWVKTHPMDPAR